LDVRMTASPDFGFLHLYIPEGQPFLCVEPVSAIPNAVNHADPQSVGLRVLAPGEVASGWMRIAAAEASARGGCVARNCDAVRQATAPPRPRRYHFASARRAARRTLR